MLIDWENHIRFACFAGVLLLMAIWEGFAPRRPRQVRRSLRWASNLGLAVLNTLTLRMLVPLGAVATATVAQEQGWGLFHQLHWPPWLTVVLSVIALDLAIYVQHILFHAMPLLWRLHQVHHADLDIDATTGLRFHTLEMLLSLGLKLVAIVLLGTPPLAVLLFEVLLNATSMFNHGNVRLPAWLDRVLRLFVVTPDMHRVHHSANVRETNSNFGFNLPWWDFLFGTYRAQPAAGHEGMTIGLVEYRDERVEQLDWMLAMPFIGMPADHPTGREQNGGRLPPAAQVAPSATMPVIIGPPEET